MLKVIANKSSFRYFSYFHAFAAAELKGKVDNLVDLILYIS